MAKTVATCQSKSAIPKSNNINMNCRSIIHVGLLAIGSGLGFGQCNFPAPASSNVVNYSFEPIVAQDRMSLQVTLEFKGGRTGKAKLELPSKWAGEKDVLKSITELTALSAQTTVSDTKSPAIKQLRFPPNSVVKVSYVLIKDWSGPLNAATRFRSDLSPEYFHIVGPTSLVGPKLDSFKTVEVRFDWSKIPESWSLASSFGTDERCQSFHGSWRDARNFLFVGGDYRTYHTTVSGNAVNFAIRGKWSFTDDEWISHVRKIIEYERDFWHDSNFPYFLITLTPFAQERGSQGGTALTNAFMEHLSRQDSISPNVLRQLAHENFHSWNPYKIGPVPDPEEQVSWFYEGFTGYYEALMLLRSGLETFPDYIQTLNANLRNYGMGEGIETSLDEFVRRHSGDKSALSGLERRRGIVIAAWLDTTIRQESHNQSSLDDLMFYLVRQNADFQQNHHGKPMVLTNKRIFAAASIYLHKTSLDRLRYYAQNGGGIQLPENALAPCVQSRTEMIGKFELGFDRSSITSDTQKVVGVKPDSEAYKAGLRDGQQLLGWSIYNGDASKQVRLTIRTDNGKQVLTYYPQGTKSSVQQFVLDTGEYAVRPEACSAQLQPQQPTTKN
jgi:predicted metalloprotease with PDZ domain